MSQLFTDYVRSLDPAGEPPDGENFGCCWRELRRLLVRELRKKGLLNSPPSYLGIHGAERWVESDWSVESIAPGTCQDALEELVAECYPYIFVSRLKRLLDHLRIKPSIDGLVVLNVRHFLYEAQKKHDPLGFRLFKILHAAVDTAVDAAVLFVLKGDPRIRNDTVLGFRPETDPGELPPVQLEEIVRQWNDVLLPEMVEGRGKARKWVVTSLRTFLARLPAEGVAGFTFRELIDPLKNDVRARWAGQFELARGETGIEDGGAVPVVGPDSGIEIRDGFRKLRQCVDESLDRLEAPPKTKGDLRTLWREQHDRAEHGEHASQRKLAAELGIPRRRLSRLLSTLGELIEACRGAGLAQAAVNLGSGAGAPTGGTMNLITMRAEALRQRTGEAMRSHAAACSELGERSGEAPRPADVFLLASTGELPVEWAVLEREAGGRGRLLAVPADSNPLVGSADVAVPEEASCGPLTLRCGFGVRLAAASFDPEMRTGTLPAEVLEQARRRWRDAREGISGEPARESDDDDPEYHRWIEEVLEPALAAVEPAAVESREGHVVRRAFPRFSHWGPVSNFYALAASILLVVSLGLGGGVVWQRQRIAELESAEPQGEGNIPFRQLRFSTEDTRSGPESVVLPAVAGELILLLNVFEFSGEPYERYRLGVLHGDTGQIIWRSEQLITVSANHLTVKLPTSLFPRGDYIFQLYGLPSDEVLAEVALSVEYE